MRLALVILSFDFKTIVDYSIQALLDKTVLQHYLLDIIMKVCWDYPHISENRASLNVILIILFTPLFTSPPISTRTVNS